MLKNKKERKGGVKLLRLKRERFRCWVRPEVVEGRLTKWNWMVQGVAGLSLGKKTDIGAFTYINARFGVEVGDGVQVGSHCAIYSESTIDGRRGRVVIGKNALVGSHSTIMPGVRVGEGALVGAHSLVKEDVPAGCVAFGVPARVVGRRGGVGKKDERLVDKIMAWLGRV